MKKLFFGLMMTAGMIALLVAFTASSAAAQNDNTGTLIPADNYSGVESAAAVCEPMASVCYGNTFVLANISESETRHLTVSLNYPNVLPNGTNGSFAVNGTWSLVVVREGKYIGTLYGKVTDGTIDYPAIEYESDKKLTLLKLQMTGGLGGFEKSRRAKTFALLNLATSFNTRQTSGTLILDF